MSRWYWPLVLWPVLARPEERVLAAVLETARVAEVYTLTGGLVKSVAVREGQWVAPGDTLVRLEDTELRWAEEAARMAFEKARKRRDRAVVLQASGGLAEQMLESLEYEVAAVRIRWQRARLNRDRALICAPLRGQVNGLTVRPGLPVTARTLLCRILDYRDLQAQLFVPADWLGEMVSGQPVRAVAPDGRVLQGRIEWISPVIDAESGRCAARVSFPGTGSAHRPGTVVRIDLREDAFH